MFYKTSLVKIVRAHRLVEGESLWRPTPNRTGDNLLLPQTKMHHRGCFLRISFTTEVSPHRATVAVQSLAYYCSSDTLVTCIRGATWSEKCENGKRQGVALPWLSPRATPALLLITRRFRVQVSRAPLSFHFAQRAPGEPWITSSAFGKQTAHRYRLISTGRLPVFGRKPGVGIRKPCVDYFLKETKN